MSVRLSMYVRKCKLPGSYEFFHAAVQKLSPVRKGTINKYGRELGIAQISALNVLLLHAMHTC